MILERITGIIGEIALDMDIRDAFHEGKAFELKYECKKQSKI